MPPTRTPIKQRFWPKVAKGDPDECWLWTAAVNPVSGYGLIGEGGRGQMLYAHRVSYELNVGPIPEGMTLDHLCNVRRCVNPAHLDPCTTEENSHRGEARRATCRRGHLKAEHSYMTPYGRSRCRACNTLKAQEYRDRKRQASD